MIPLAEAAATGGELAYLRDTIEAGWFSTAGPVVCAFEERLVAMTGARNAVATLSGTAALHLALATLGVGSGDDVIVSDMSFIASANAVRYCGARPVFVDSQLSDWQVDVALLADLIKARYERRAGEMFDRDTGRRLAAIMPVHLLGGLADLDGVHAIASSAGVPVVEDAAQAMGARWKTKPLCTPLELGSSTERIVCTSFNGNKIITCGNGGALLCDSEEFARKARHLASTARISCPDDYYVHDNIGFNYRMSSLSAAVGLAQLEVLESRVHRKREIAAQYRDACQEWPEVVGQPTPDWVSSTYWLYGLLLPTDARPAVMMLHEAGVESRTFWRPLSRQIPHCDQPNASAKVADQLWRRGLCIPCGHAMTDSDVRLVVAALRQTMQSIAG